MRHASKTLLALAALAACDPPDDVRLEPCYESGGDVLRFDLGNLRSPLHAELASAGGGARPLLVEEDVYRAYHLYDPGDESVVLSFCRTRRAGDALRCEEAGDFIFSEEVVFQPLSPSDARCAYTGVKNPGSGGAGGGGQGGGGGAGGASCEPVGAACVDGTTCCSGTCLLGACSL